MRNQPVAGRLRGRRPTPSFASAGVVAALLLILGFVAWSNLPGASSPEPSASDVAAASEQVASLNASGPSNTPSTEPTSVPSPEPSIVDRPGVPAALYDKYWSKSGQVGQIGTTASFKLPSNERFLGADEGRIASVIYDADAHVPVVGPNGVTIIVRELQTGKTVRSFDTPVYVTEALVAGSQLFWIGRSLADEGSPRIDAGVWALDLADPASAPRAVVGPSDLSKTYGNLASRGLLRLTDRGRAVTTEIAGDTALVTEIIDVSSLTARGTIEIGRAHV